MSELLDTPRRYNAGEFECYQCQQGRATGVVFHSKEAWEPEIVICDACVMLGFAQVPPSEVPPKVLLIALIEANCNTLAAQLVAEPPSKLTIEITDSMRQLRGLLRELKI